MLLPRFTIRTLLVMLTIGAVISVIVGIAVRGHDWAWGVTIALLSLVLTALVHAVWCSVVWLLSRLLSEKRKTPLPKLD